MRTEFKLPPLGENVTSGTVVSVTVSVGATVRKDQAVMEVETEKAVLDVPCPMGGKVVEIRVKAGDKLSRHASWRTLPAKST